MHGGRPPVECATMNIEGNGQACRAVDTSRAEDIDAQTVFVECLLRALERLPWTDRAKLERLKGGVRLGKRLQRPVSPGSCGRKGVREAAEGLYGLGIVAIEDVANNLALRQNDCDLLAPELSWEITAAPTSVCVGGDEAARTYGSRTLWTSSRPWIWARARTTAAARTAADTRRNTIAIPNTTTLSVG